MQNSLAAINLDGKTEVPLYRQFYEQIRHAILDKRFALGFRLPSTREMAREFGVSRNTVTAAFEQLAAEGYLETRTGAGTFVSQKIPEDFLNVKSAKIIRRKKVSKNRSVSERGKLLKKTPVSFESTADGLRPFVPCVPSLEDFPFHIWAKIAARRLKKPIRSLLDYGDTAGFRPLREGISVHLGAARAVKCSAEQIIIVSGVQQAADLTARILLDVGDAVWAEDPGYLGTRGAMIAAGARIIPVPVDEEGLRVETGVKLAPDAKLACVTPSHQYPLGVTMSLARRFALLEWARESGGWILEDDYDSEFRYESRPLAALQGLGDDDCVIYAGTFSKVLCPALRLGFLVVPPNLIDDFIAAKALLDRHSPMFEQVVLADFIGDGHFTRHIRQMRQIYAERREILTESIQKNLGEWLEIAPSSAGLHLTVRLPRNFDDVKVARLAQQAGVETEPLSLLSIEPSGSPGLILGFAPFHKNEIKNSVEILAKILHKLKGKTDRRI